MGSYGIPQFRMIHVAARDKCSHGEKIQAWQDKEHISDMRLFIATCAAISMCHSFERLASLLGILIKCGSQFFQMINVDRTCRDGRVSY